VLALGPRTGPFYLAERTLVPASGQFWVASMATLLAVPAMALLSASGVAAMTAAAPAEPRHRRAPWPWLGALALLGVLPVPTLVRASGPETTLDATAEPTLARFGREDHAARVLSTRIADVSSWETAGITMAPEFRTNA